MKALRIIKCDDPNKWYASLVGEVVPLLEVEKTEYKSKEPKGFINFVSKEDAEIVNLSRR